MRNTHSSFLSPSLSRRRLLFDRRPLLLHKVKSLFTSIVEGLDDCIFGGQGGRFAVLGEQVGDGAVR